MDLRINGGYQAYLYVVLLQVSTLYLQRLDLNRRMDDSEPLRPPINDYLLTTRFVAAGLNLGKLAPGGFRLARIWLSQRSGISAAWVREQHDRDRTDSAIADYRRHRPREQLAGDGISVSCYFGRCAILVSNLTRLSVRAIARGASIESSVTSSTNRH